MNMFNLIPSTVELEMGECAGNCSGCHGCSGCSGCNGLQSSGNARQ